MSSSQFPTGIGTMPIPPRQLETYALETGTMMLLESRPLQPFKSSEEYLYAMKEDLAEWLNVLYKIGADVDCFMDKLETGVVLCQVMTVFLILCHDLHANPTYSTVCKE
jgi:hypothetical protein